MADDREPLGRAAFAGHVSGLAEQETPPWQDRPPVWDELSGGDREFYMRIGACVAVAERERIAALAVEHGAVYCQRGVCTCIRLGSSPTIRPFADLIREPQERTDDKEGPRS